MVHFKKCLIQLLFIVSALIAVIMLNYVTKVLMFKLKIVNRELIDPKPTGQSQIVVKSDVLISKQELPQCNCTRTIKSFEKSISGKSSCSKQALERGSHQKVIAFTFFVG